MADGSVNVLPVPAVGGSEFSEALASDVCKLLVPPSAQSPHPSAPLLSL